MKLYFCDSCGRLIYEEFNIYQGKRNYRNKTESLKAIHICMRCNNENNSETSSLDFVLIACSKNGSFIIGKEEILKIKNILKSKIN